jgi:hypothetical protein
MLLFFTTSSVTHAFRAFVFTAFRAFAFTAAKKTFQAAPSTRWQVCFPSQEHSKGMPVHEWLWSPLMHTVTFEHNSFTQTPLRREDSAQTFSQALFWGTIFGNHMLASTYILFLHAGGSFSLRHSQVTQTYQCTGRKIGKKNRMCYTNILQQCVKTHEKCF